MADEFSRSPEMSSEISDDEYDQLMQRSPPPPPSPKKLPVKKRLIREVIEVSFYDFVRGG